MPLSLEAPVLQVDANVIHKVDTTNPANLFSMWTVFARCRDSVAQGRRLENLSWRLWNRETFCCENDDISLSTSTTSKPQDIPHGNTEDVPQLSGSVDSVADEEAVDFGTESAPVDIVRPRIRRQDSCASSRSRGNQRHITSDELEKMVVSIMESKEPLTAPLPNIPRCLSVEQRPASPRTGSTTSQSSCNSSDNLSAQSSASEPVREAAPQLPNQPRATIVTRGFSPAQVPATLLAAVQASKAPSPSAIPGPDEAPAAKPVFPKRQQAKFALGGSSCSEDGSYQQREIEARRQPTAQPRQKMFQLGASSVEDDSPREQRVAAAMTAQRKNTSFNKQVVTQTFNTSAVSDSEDDYSESAIDDSAIDDDDEWEEEDGEESDSGNAPEKIEFRRVESTANLTSRRSLITLMLAQTQYQVRNQSNARPQRFGNGIASQSTSALHRAGRPQLNGPTVVNSPNDSDEAPLMMKRNNNRAPPMRPINEIPRSAAQPINVAAQGMHFQAALSPRTTRRNMLATELTESLRRNLLRERSQKSSTANAVLKRRHTSHDIANLRQFPEKPFMKKEEDANASSWDQYFQNPFAGYSAQAW
ncbi:uncharacterized protein CTHT_0044270 [Thermochaetoides thermophila DSM 1495]|uniref:Uncharacterized protein n=1 Tax=Chaetomium thermophilum (strain DSM 1495 / CBS 144.50 / IMI 039719) TaxID=759272 RepID=G0S923_CHATD|nr:hypothetical protein CTHT_0044270 [Thermochaetoides thermophila DSM 1495]EGS19934.1 hypothetical protein CTHT_0044270 [Thermochaetoides thermophila DSM 1495]